ncbi:MAG: hypothetical protein AB1916_11865 [Thermodesulfobacteriota bacterium]
MAVLALAVAVGRGAVAVGRGAVVLAVVVALPPSGLRAWRW